ncbi:MAG: hypothetical protein ACOVRJ_19420 [Roseateles sp.]
MMVDVAAIGRSGPLEPIVFLHGFGSTKENYTDIVGQPQVAQRLIRSLDIYVVRQKRATWLIQAWSDICGAVFPGAPQTFLTPDSGLFGTKSRKK